MAADRVRLAELYSGPLMPLPGSVRAATTMMVPVTPVVLPETLPQVDEGVRRGAYAMKNDFLGQMSCAS